MRDTRVARVVPASSGSWRRLDQALAEFLRGSAFGRHSSEDDPALVLAWHAWVCFGRTPRLTLHDTASRNPKQSWDLFHSSPSVSCIPNHSPVGTTPKSQLLRPYCGDFDSMNYDICEFHQFHSDSFNMGCTLPSFIIHQLSHHTQISPHHLTFTSTCF